LLYLKGESRSHDPRFLEIITRNIRRCFTEAAASVRNVRGRRARIEMSISRDYRAFRLSDAAPVVTDATTALRAMGLTPVLEATNGGLDANYLNEKGIPCVTLGAGQHHPHTTDEYADVDEYLTACALLVRLATTAATPDPKRKAELK
jgi:tripeptide aminopeptidase